MIFEFVAYLIVQATSLLVGGLIWVITFPIRETRSIIVNAQWEAKALAAAADSWLVQNEHFRGDRLMTLADIWAWLTTTVENYADTIGKP